MENKIKNLLLSLGVRPNLLGFSYLADAILICYNYPWERKIFLTKEIYPEIAYKYGTTPSRVERAMRHAIEHMSEAVDYDMIASILNTQTSVNKGKFTNGEFIHLCVTKLKMDEPRN